MSEEQHETVANLERQNRSREYFGTCSDGDVKLMRRSIGYGSMNRSMKQNWWDTNVVKSKLSEEPMNGAHSSRPRDQRSPSEGRFTRT